MSPEEQTRPVDSDDNRTVPDDQCKIRTDAQLVLTLEELEKDIPNLPQDRFQVEEP
jgi:hypothetical protein